VIGRSERFLEPRRTVFADCQKTIGKAEAMLLANSTSRSRRAIVTAVVMLSPVNLASSAASRWVSLFLKLRLMSSAF
jgi:hypothetical protein